MIYFCADDYGISDDSNDRIEECLTDGALNKVSVLPNGKLDDFKRRLTEKNAHLSLHLNLVDGRPTVDGLDLLTTKDGYFKNSFVGLFLLSLSPKRKKLQDQLYKEIKNQLHFWHEKMGQEQVFIDSHQHTHMIPLVFKTLLCAIEDEKLSVKALRFPAEPLMP